MIATKKKFDLNIYIQCLVSSIDYVFSLLKMGKSSRAEAEDLAIKAAKSAATAAQELVNGHRLVDELVEILRVYLDLPDHRRITHRIFTDQLVDVGL